MDAFSSLWTMLQREICFATFKRNDIELGQRMAGPSSSHKIHVRRALFDIILQNSALKEPDARKMFGELTSAVAYCHDLGFCHRDLKCENILLAADLSVRLTDFGFARPIEYDENGEVVLSNTFCGSAAYAAPEIIQGKAYDPRKHDSWSLGVILYIMVCGSMPYDDSNVRKMLKEQLARK